MAAKKPSPAKTFNATARVFFKEIRKIFSRDVTMELLSGKLDEYSKEARVAHVPALQFYKAMNTKTGIVVDGRDRVVGEMVLDHDALLFSKDCQASIPQLDVIDFKTKWAALSAENREFVWGYLERMAKLSAETAASKAMDQADMVKMVGAMQRVAERVEPGATPISKAKELLADKDISEITEKVIERMDSLCVSAPQAVAAPKK